MDQPARLIELPSKLDLSSGVVHEILRDNLDVRKFVLVESHITLPMFANVNKVFCSTPIGVYLRYVVHVMKLV